MEHVISKLTDFSGSKDEELRDIAGLGALPPPIYACFLALYAWFSFTDYIQLLSSQDNYG